MKKYTIKEELTPLIEKEIRAILESSTDEDAKEILRLTAKAREIEKKLKRLR